MSRQLLNLPVNIPWKLIAVSPDMMDTQFCNKQFPFAWRSSLAVSAYEPAPEELPEKLCGDRITYLKITATITGYQPTREESEIIRDLEEPLGTSFPEVPTEDIRGTLERILADYFACYGVLLNVAVFPFPGTKKELSERHRIRFAQLGNGEPGALLDNPFVDSAGVSFLAPGQPNNRLIDLFPSGGDGQPELDLQQRLEVTLPSIPGLAAVEARVALSGSSPVTMEAFQGPDQVGSQTSPTQPGQVHQLSIEEDNMDRVVLTASDSASLLELALWVGKDVPVTLDDYPHILDLEPKVRDLYQAASESGEVLTSSRSGLKVDKSFTHTESTENRLSLSAGFQVPVPGTPVTLGGGAETSVTSTDTDQANWAVQTDASRERRETQGTTTQLSQMYNLLTGYHAGTNRSVHLMLARPHVLQPTDFRTFVQGLRAIEGIQEFFLIVSRPSHLKGLCVEALLETGHFPEGVFINEPPTEYLERFEDFVVTADSKGDGAIQEFPTSVYAVESSWVINRLKGDPFHGGLQFLGGRDASGSFSASQVEGRVDNFNYQPIDDTTVQVVGQVRDLGPIKNFVELNFRVFTRSEDPRPARSQAFADVSRLLITSRGLCVCFESGDCPEVVPPPPPPFVESIVGEPRIRIDASLLAGGPAGGTRLPAMKELLQKIQSALATSGRVPERHEFGKLGFLDSDSFKDQLKRVLPAQYLRTPLRQVSGLPDSFVQRLGERTMVGEVLDLELKTLARKSGLDSRAAAKIRRRLLGLTPPRQDSPKKGAKGKGSPKK